MIARWIWSQIVNAGWWMFHIYRLPGAIRSMSEFPEKVSDIIVYMTGFEYKKDSFRDWSPWVITAIARKFDDCDGAAEVWNWAMRRAGYGGKVVFLDDRNSKSGHAVYVTQPYDIDGVGMVRFVGSNSRSYQISDSGYPDTLCDIWRPERDYVIV